MGAALACNRLLKALNKAGLDSKLLVQNKYSFEENVISISKSQWEKVIIFFRFIYERIIIYFNEKSPKMRYNYSVANSGKNIKNNSLIKDADIINIHWINQGYLSLKSIKKLAHLNKPVVWTLHDMWAFTGGCHYSMNCDHFLRECGNCPLLKFSSKKDLSNRIWRKKEKYYKNLNLTIIALSGWLGKNAKESSLFKNFRIEVIPNPINVNVYRQIEKYKAIEKLNLPLDKYLLLFGSMKISDERKGFHYFKECLEQLKSKYPELTNKVEIILFGSSQNGELEKLPFKTNYLGMLHDENQICTVYNAATLFVLPSLEDNLPNTIMESLSCGTPVVAFNNSGISDLIDHQENGYLAKDRSVEDLAAGIHWVIENETRYAELCKNARTKVMNNYTYEIVASKYKTLFKELLSKS